jgi:hypothetical protein
VSAVPFIVSGEHAAEGDIGCSGALRCDVGGDPLREGDARGAKILNAERCSASLSSVTIEPRPAPDRAVGSPTEPVVADLTGPVRLLLSSHGFTSRALTYAARLISV